MMTGQKPQLSFYPGFLVSQELNPEIVLRYAETIPPAA